MKGEFISIESAKINADIEKENKELQERIDKAIEYIKENTYKWKDTQFGEYVDMESFNVNCEPSKLLNILEGKDENI